MKISDVVDAIEWLGSVRYETQFAGLFWSRQSCSLDDSSGLTLASLEVLKSDSLKSIVLISTNLPGIELNESTHDCMAMSEAAAFDVYEDWLRAKFGDGPISKLVETVKKVAESYKKIGATK